LLKTSHLFSTLYSILHGLPWLGGFSCVQFSTHAPAEDCSFDWAAGIHTAPSTATPSAQKWNDIGTDVILAKNFKRLVRRRNTLVSEGVDREAMAFKPNYGRDRAERARAARARSEEKKRKRDEKTALRKAERAEVEPPTDETNARLDEKQS
jgi:hypothetical protein